MLFFREPSPVEVYNDIDNRLVNIMRVLQNKETYDEFCYRISKTLYSLEEFRTALSIMNGGSSNHVDQAWAFFVSMNQGFGGWVPKYEGNWGKKFTSARGMASNVSAWNGRIDRLNLWHERIARVQIDSRDALDVIRYWDSPDTTFYVDPPYIQESRLYSDEGGHSYAKEPDDDYHRQLISVLTNCAGYVTLSAYPAPLYENLLDAGFEKLEFDRSCSAAGRKRGSKMRGEGAAKREAPRTEVVWRNAKAVQSSVEQQANL